MSEPDGYLNDQAASQPEEQNPPSNLTGSKADPNFPVIGIGASAGGLEAFEDFFTGLPADTGMAFVLVQHLSPPHKSILPEIIQRFTPMPVAQVTNGVRILPNQIYVIPPGTDLAMHDGHLTLLKPEAERGYRLPIDFFFRSLARDQHERAIGVVLSGTGSDGSLGIKSIKAEAGLTIAQSPETAAFQDMPRNAIATQDVDFILPPSKMGDLILKIVHHQVVNDYREDTSKLPVPTRSMQKLFYTLHGRTGHDFSQYKQNTVQRRIERRMKVNLVKSMDDYVAFLQSHPQEVDALFHEMLINVTNFFRDPDAYRALADKVLLPIIQEKCATKTPLRVWVAGCSSGEEAYSLAIMIQEKMDGLKSECPVQIFGTDIDEEAIQVARAGLYRETISEDVSEERLQRFFNREEGGYQIKKAIRDRVVFATQNVISDPPFSKIDLMCCRNLLIYLEPDLQDQLFTVFYHALSPRGFLFLGGSESVSGHSALFLTMDRKYKIYQRKETAASAKIAPAVKYPQREASSPHVVAPMLNKAPPSRLREWIEKALLEAHTPACVVIDEKHDLVYVHGHTGKYLEPAPGDMHANLLHMARDGLKAELATSLHSAVNHHEIVRRSGVMVKTNGDYQPITLTVQPIDSPLEYRGFLLVIFEDERPSPAQPAAPLTGREARRRQLVELQKQLKEKDEYLQTIIDELETANQDLKSSNEEQQSINEEMQSTNEELETSKEELQSSNEELTTINTELQKKNEELAGVNNDMFNLLASTEIGTLFLDLDLKLRRYTPAVNRVYNFVPSDIGRPVDHFVSRLNYDGFADDLRHVLETLQPKAVEVQNKDGAWFLVNIRPYRTLENAIDGVVITFVDITQQKHGDDLRRMGTIVRDSNDAVTVLDLSGKILAWNRGATQMYGWEEEEARRMTFFEMIPEDRRSEAAHFFDRISRGELVRSYETQRLTRDGQRLDVWMTLTALVNDAGKPVGIATTERDITDRNRAMQRLAFGNRALKALTSWYRRLIDPVESKNLAGDACRILVEQSGYRFAWVGQLERPGKLVNPVDWAGLDGHEFDAGKEIRNFANAAQAAVEQAITSKRPVASRNLKLDAAKRGGNAGARRVQYGAYAALPLLNGNQPPGVLVVYAAEPVAFEDQELELLNTLSASLAEALETGGRQSS